MIRNSAMSHNIEFPLVIQVCFPLVERKGDHFWGKESTGFMSSDTRGGSLSSASLRIW